MNFTDVGKVAITGKFATALISNDKYFGSAVGDIQVEFDSDGGNRDVVLGYVAVSGEPRQVENMEYYTTYLCGWSVRWWFLLRNHALQWCDRLRRYRRLFQREQAVNNF